MQSSHAATSAGKLRIFVIHGSHHLTDHSFHGDGLVAWGFISELARRGHTIDVATDRLDVKSAIPDNCTLVEFSRSSKNSLVHYMSYLLRTRRYYKSLVARGRVDVVHQMNPVIRGLSLALIGERVPIVLGTYVGDWKAYRKQPLSRRLKKLAAFVIDAIQQQFASALVLATPYALSRVPFSAGVADRLEFMHHGVDTELYHPAPAKTDPPAIPQSVLYVGSLQYHKGVLTLVTAFAQVARRFPESRLIVVGDGTFLDAMKAQLEKSGLAGKALFVGRQSREEVAGWLRATTVLCAPSLSEPYGQNVLEAMATGKPVVLSTEGGHRYIGDEVGSIAVPPRDPDRLAAALCSILENPLKAEQMGRHNRNLAEQRHAWPKVADRLEEIYHRAIARQEPTDPNGMGRFTYMAVDGMLSTQNG